MRRCRGFAKSVSRRLQEWSLEVPCSSCEAQQIACDLTRAVCGVRVSMLEGNFLCALVEKPISSDLPEATHLDSLVRGELAEAVHADGSWANARSWCSRVQPGAVCQAVRAVARKRTMQLPMPGSRMARKRCCVVPGCSTMFRGRVV